MFIEIFLKTALSPAFGVALLFLLFGGAPEPWRARVQALVFAAGFSAACYLLDGAPSWPPQGGALSLVWVAVWFALFSWVAPPDSMLRYVFRGVWVVVGCAIALWSLRAGLLKSPLHSRNILALVLLGWGIGSILERSTRTSHPLTGVAMAMLSFISTSFLFLFNGSLLMSQMLTSLAVLTGALCVLAWLFPKRLSLHGLWPFLGGFLGVIWITGYVFLDVRPWRLIEMAIPFFVLLLKDLFRRKAASPLMETWMTFTVAAVPLAYILWRVFQTSGPLY